MDGRDQEILVLGPREVGGDNGANDAANDGPVPHGGTVGPVQHPDRTRIAGAGAFDHIELGAALSGSQRRARVREPIEGFGPNQLQPSRKGLNRVRVTGAGVKRAGPDGDTWRPAGQEVPDRR